MNDELMQMLESLFHHQEDIRKTAEFQMNRIYGNLENIKKSLDLLKSENTQLNKTQILRLTIYLKNWLIQNYMASARYIQLDIQFYLFNNMSQFRQESKIYIQEIISYYIQRDYPQSQIFDQLINLDYPNDDELELWILTLPKLFKFKKQIHVHIENVNKQLIKCFLVNPNQIKVPQLYLLLAKSQLMENKIFNSIFYQLEYHLNQGNIYTPGIQIYLKSLTKYCYFYISCINEGQIQNLLTLLYQKYIINQITILDISNKDQVVNQLLKLINVLFRYSTEFKFGQILENMLKYTIQNGILLNDNMYSFYIGGQNDKEIIHFSVNLRQNAKQLLNTLNVFGDSQAIFTYIIVQIEFQHNLILEQQMQSKYVLYDLCLLEAFYFSLNTIFDSFDTVILNDLYLETMRLDLVQDQLLLPIKIQIMSILNKAINRNYFDVKFMKQFAVQVLNSIKMHNNPHYQLLLIESGILMIQKNDEVKDYLVNSNFVCPQELISFYAITDDLRVKERILLLFVKLNQIFAIDQWLINQISLYWNSDMEDQNSKYKPKIETILKTIIEIINTWQFDFWLKNLNFFLSLIGECFKLNFHYDLCQETLLNILTKFISNNFTQLSDKQRELIRQIQINLLDKFHNITTIQIYSLLVILNIHDQDQLLCNYQLQIVFTTQNNGTLMMNRQLYLITLAMYHQKTQVDQFFRLYLDEQLFDFGHTYLDMACWFSVLQERGYDVKQLIMQLSEDVQFKEFLPILLKKSFELLIQLKDYRLQYYIRFLICLLRKENILFDLQYLNLENHNFTAIIKDQLQQLSYIISNQTIFDEFQKIWKLNLPIRQEILEKYQWRDVSDLLEQDGLVQRFNSL